MSKDTCIKANTYCPVHKGIVGADCWHDSKDFSVPRTDWKQVDEINTLREQVEKLTEECVVLRASNRTKLDTIAYLETREDENQQKIKTLTKERDAEIARNKPLRALISSERQANAALTEELAALAGQNEKMREACEFAAERFDHPDNADRMLVALSLPDITSPVLNRIRRNLRKG